MLNNELRTLKVLEAGLEPARPKEHRILRIRNILFYMSLRIFLFVFGNILATNQIFSSKNQ